MRSTTFHCDDVGGLSVQIADCITPDFQPTLAIVFNSIKQDITSITEVFNEHHIDVVGCSTAGEIVDDELYEESIAVMLLDMNREYYKIHFTTYGDEQVYQNSYNAGTITKETFKNPGLLVMSGGMTVDAEKMVFGIKDGIGKEIPIYGGLAADDLKMKRTFAFTNHDITDNGVVLVIIDTDKISMQGMAISGWKPIGGIKTITKAKGNVVYTIDNEPAYDVFVRYFGLSDETKSKSDYLISIQTNYPLQFIRDGYSILRSPLAINEAEQTIGLAAGVKEGEQFRFSNSPGFEVVEQTVQEFNQLKEATPEADALLLFSCKGRHGAFGPVLEDEISGLYEYWNTPMLGFLSYGEIGNTPSGVCEFHNETCSLVLLKEK